MRKLLGYVLVAGTAAVLVDLTGVEAGPKASLVAAVLTAFVAAAIWSRVAQAAHKRWQTQDRSSHE
jgi:hypothetical protein